MLLAPGILPCEDPCMLYRSTHESVANSLAQQACAGKGIVEILVCEATGKYGWSDTCAKITPAIPASSICTCAVHRLQAELHGAVGRLHSTSENSVGTHPTQHLLVRFHLQPLPSRATPSLPKSPEQDASRVTQQQQKNLPTATATATTSARLKCASLKS